jgi:hypothetical protein
MRRYSILQKNKDRTAQSAVKSKKSYYRKPDSVKQLEQLSYDADCRKHPSVDPRFIAKRSYRDDSANSLTRCITDYIKISNGFASRVNVSGTWRPGLNKYTYSTTRRGLSDIVGTWQGLSLYIEVKASKGDRQSDDQRKVEQEVTAAGAYYYLAHDFTGVVEWINTLPQ